VFTAHWIIVACRRTALAAADCGTTRTRERGEFDRQRLAVEPLRQRADRALVVGGQGEVVPGGNCGTLRRLRRSPATGATPSRAEENALTPNPTALVTGAARGIGLAVTRRFLAEGWNAALYDIDGITLAATAATLDAEGTAGRSLAIEGDVALPGQVAEAVARIEERFGRIDALVNNAGIAIFRPIGETTAADWQRVIDVNLTGPFLCTQAALPLLRAAASAGRPAAIVNIASISGLRASTLRVAYGTSKAGLIQLTKQQAAELGAEGIRANAIAPGPVDTAMARAVHDAAIRAAYHDAIPLGRYGSEEEIANAVWFLCSAQAGYVNGQVLAVDGGFDSTGIGLPALRSR
jgi:NAD(P)-dependent dehydrogenase (short-subunit alcohol dehydrogenase family)